MMSKISQWLKENGNRFPGWAAKSLMLVFTWIAAYWSIGELYHEGWWGRWYNPAAYLIPVSIFLGLTLAAIRWPKVGGGIIIAFGIFAGFFFGAPPVGVALVFLGGLFWLEGRRVAKLDERPRNLRWTRLAVIPTVLIILGFSIYMAPVILTRQDDGDRTARRIAGNGVELVWAPEGPGWNWQQPWGGYPGWDAIALYGLDPVGMDWRSKPGYGRMEDGTWHHATAGDMAEYNVCLYLDEDGLTLMDERQDIWRMPTVDEAILSMARHGDNAGCVWDGEYKVQVACEILPDKETPLWAPDLSPIYYWTVDEHDDSLGYFVSYNGFVSATTKNSGNPRHSYRCV
ncbi:MAG TPA: hypothetical protein VJ965_08655, partial [Anaerolineales bacterium]|nr:hypothetical protein [Anaerolineales bacterium]